MAKTSNPIIVRAGMTIGSISAETDDDFLFECFVTNPAVTTSESVQAPGMILSGRTGSGKTAIVRQLSRTEENVVTIDPFDMALSYVSNSDILQFLQSIGADLDLLFQVLWKHVLCIEFIRLRFHVNDAKKSRNIFQKLIDSVGNDPRREKSVEYLRDWEGRFFITMDKNIKDITDKYTTALKVDLEHNVPGIIKAGATYDTQIDQEVKQQVIQRAKQIISSDQLAKLSGVIDILSDQSEGDKVKYYIVIDRLDEKWIDDVMRFRLVRALIESLKSFRKIPNLKILVALRSDILERVMLETTDLGFQREKYQEYFIKLTWTRSELKELVQKRIGLLFKRRYTGSTVKFEDLFTAKVGESEPFDYILHRTLKRPRDIISFVNECLKKAEGQQRITARFVREAEKQYSRIRMAALEDELRSTFPSLARLLNFLSRRRPSVPMSELWDDEAALELALAIVTDPDMSRDPLTQHAYDAINSTSPKALQAFLQHTVAILYRVGAVGVKLQAHERFQYSDTDSPILTPEQLTADVPVRVHLMLHQALNIRR